MGQQAARARVEGARLAAAAVALGVLARLAYGPGSLGYDAAWALVWGREAAHGTQPSFTAPVAPTPHPLANLLAVALAPLGEPESVVLALSWLSLGALGVLAFAFARELFSAALGVLFAALLLTRPLLVAETRQAIVDVPFLAVVLAAGWLLVRGPRTRPAVPVLLAIAGLLRPEAWALSLGWWLYARRGEWRWLALALAAPVLWAAMDLAATGDPLHSLHGTRALAEELGRPRDTGTALSAAPAYLRLALHAPAIWLGLAGAALALVLGDRRATLPLVVTGVALVGFLVLGVTGLPLLVRYLLLPAVLLGLFAAYLALGWIGAPAYRGWWLPGGMVALAVMAVAVPAERGRLLDSQAFSGQRAGVQDDLLALVRVPAVRAVARRCRAVGVPDYRARPLLALELDRPPADFRDGAGPGLALAYATPRAAGYFSALPTPPPPGLVPPGSRRLAANRSWLAAVAGC